MLSELRIQNFAIIQDLTLQFEPGFVVFTGETGAGKSIILDALSAVLGERMETTVIRKGADRAVVEATFKLSPELQRLVNPLLETEGLLEQPDQMMLSREIRAEGRSIARINGRSVAVSLQSEVGSFLVDLHGQSEHLSLLKVKHHRELVDRFAHQDVLNEAYHAQYKHWSQVTTALKEARNLSVNAQDRIDMLKYQVQEIQAAKLVPDEEGALKSERARLANAETLHQLSAHAIASLDEGEGQAVPVTDLLGQTTHDITELSRIDETLLPLAERLEQVLSNASEIAYELRGYLESIEFNPRRLDQIEERLNTLTQLKRKYGGSLDSVITYLSSATVELSKVDNIDDQIEQLEKVKVEIEITLADLAKEISLKRHDAAKILAERIDAVLQELNMQSAHFQTQIRQTDDLQGLLIDGRRLAFDAHGVDQVEFLIETNPGEGFKPLVKIASGGETSRLMLALKHALAEADQIPTLVFDEIDQGVGGRVGSIVGQLLWSLGREHQVLCVTHLPQLAAFGDQHFNVSKQQEDGRTFTQVDELASQARLNELAAMLGPLSPGTMQSAGELISAVRVFTSKIDIK